MAHGRCDLTGSCNRCFNTCGKPNCPCVQGQKHGPFYYLTQCLAAGKMNKFLLKTPASQQNARAAAAAFNEFYDGMEELSQVNAELLRREQPDRPRCRTGTRQSCRK
jgi:hypothetical protein